MLQMWFVAMIVGNRQGEIRELGKIGSWIGDLWRNTSKVPENYKTRKRETNEMHRKLLMYTRSLDENHIMLGKDIYMSKRLKGNKLKCGMLDTKSLDTEELDYVLKAYSGTPEPLLDSNYGRIQLIVDCGASSHATGDRTDFREGTLEELDSPVFMEGISGRMPATHK